MVEANPMPDLSMMSAAAWRTLLDPDQREAEGEEGESARLPIQVADPRLDMAQGFPPVERTPDYVVMDVPYLSCFAGQYSSGPDDIANRDEAAWTSAMAAVAKSCASVSAKFCTVAVPNWVNSNTGDVVLCTEIVNDVWTRAGYMLHRVCYASKGIQAAG